MHTFTSGMHEMEDGVRREVTIIHNGDYSGDAIVTVRAESQSNAFEFRVPCEALLAFSAEKVADDVYDFLKNR